MAERRMFHTAVVESDAFLDLPIQAQALYFHLGMHADDDGHEPERCRGQMKRGRSVCRGLQGASLLCQAQLPQGTANGNPAEIRVF